jgi:hypothetical protein
MKNFQEIAIAGIIRTTVGDNPSFRTPHNQNDCYQPPARAWEPHRKWIAGYSHDYEHYFSITHFGYSPTIFAILGANFSSFKIESTTVTLTRTGANKDYRLFTNTAGGSTSTTLTFPVQSTESGYFEFSGLFMGVVEDLQTIQTVARPMNVKISSPVDDVKLLSGATRRSDSLIKKFILDWPRKGYQHTDIKDYIDFLPDGKSEPFIFIPDYDTDPNDMYPVRLVKDYETVEGENNYFNDKMVMEGMY